MTSPEAGGAAEWKAHWPLPIAAALGYTTGAIYTFGFGAYIGPISESFGWSRTLVTSGLSLAVGVQALFSLPIGMAVDRFGPRWLGVAGTALLCAAFALLGTATGSAGNWIMLWVLMALASLLVQGTVWTSAVASRFEASRGLAFAVTLCGSSMAAALFPALGAWLIGKVGWQQAAFWQAGLWFAVAFPIILLFFRSARDSEQTAARTEAVAVEPTPLQGQPLSQGFRSTVYHRLLIASLCFTLTGVALVIHFIPILTDGGTDPVMAAGMAALIGVASIVGRLCTGVLLDRFPAAKIGALAFLLPAIASGLLLADGQNPASQAIAAVLIGLALGAELDVIAYLTAQHFGLRNFGGLYGGLLTALNGGSAMGPLAAALVFDLSGSYAPYLWLTIVLMLIASLALASLPTPGRRTLAADRRMPMSDNPGCG